VIEGVVEFGAEIEERSSPFAGIDPFEEISHPGPERADADGGRTLNGIFSCGWRYWFRPADLKKPAPTYS
jgi:hypothetical protein